MLPSALDATTIEFGDPATVGRSPRIAVLAHYSTSPTASRSVRTLLSHLSHQGYQPVVVSSADTGPLDWAGWLPPGAVVVRKANVGYDFGSWAVALALFPRLVEAEHVLLVNDSMVGPFVDLGPLVRGFEAGRADVWGLTDSWQYRHHMQSYFLGFRGGTLALPPLAAFWSGIRHERSKWDVVRRNELGLGRLAARHRLTMSAAFPSDGVVPWGANVAVRGWRELLDLGFPFVKRSVALDPQLAPAVSHALRERFGLLVGDWL